MEYIYQHLGLGDHIVCNGLVRNLINSGKEYKMFVKHHNYDSVSFMYRDLQNLSFIAVNDDQEVSSFITKNKNGEDNLITIGFESREGVGFDKLFYIQHLIPFEKRWSDFKIMRDYDREDYLYKKLNPSNEKFILIHRSGSDGADRINYDILSKDIKLIYVENHTGNIFDYLGLSEKAEEIHCVESSFHHIIDSLDLNKNIFFHNNKNSRGFHHTLNDNWKIV